MTAIGQLTASTALVTMFALWADGAIAQGQIQPLPRGQVLIDEDILAAFVEEPCHHFEAARDYLIAGQYQQAAQHLRTASAFLRLEAARADLQGRAALDASAHELQSLAGATERGPIPSVTAFLQAFSRAHYALARHHCVASARRCCQAATFEDRKEMVRAGRDLLAAALHAERGSQWEGNALDTETAKTLRSSQLTAKNLIEQGRGSQRSMQRAIQKLHGQLETLTGRKILLAQPLTPGETRGGPSIFH